MYIEEFIEYAWTMKIYKKYIFIGNIVAAEVCAPSLSTSSRLSKKCLATYTPSKLNATGSIIIRIADQFLVVI